MKKISIDPNYASHQLVLSDIIKKTNGPILELGAGDYSTNLIHKEAKGRRLVTIDDSKAWIDRFSALAGSHEFIYLDRDGISKYYENDKTHWSIVFIDSSIWDLRMAAINRYKDSADYLIIHDIEYAVGQGYMGVLTGGNRYYNDIFKYWIEFLPYGEGYTAHTLLGSNKHELNDIEGIITVNRS